MPRVLYNKYRSSDFDKLIGQEHITRVLKNAVKSGKISHAYLFTGSRGTGKTSTARILARALNCEKLKTDGNPCGECAKCIAISEGKFMDLIEIDAASNRGIDQIRELKERVEFSPVEGKYKIYIIDEVHMLTKEAFNALLKTLEEPPEHAVFVLATTDVHKLPATILSRCQRYDFRLGSDKEIEQAIKGVAKGEGISLSKGALNILVENANGSYRDGLSLLDVVVSGQISSSKPEEVSESEVRKTLGIPDSTMVYHLLETLVYGKQKEALELIEEMESKGVNFQQFTKFVLLSLQDILVRKIKGGSEEKEHSFAKGLSVSEVSALINIFLSADRNLRYAVIPSLILEMAIPQVIDIVGEKHSVPQKEESTSKGKAEKKEEEIDDDEEQEEEEEEGEEESRTSSKGAIISFEQISKEWQKVVEKIKPANGHLFAFLGGAKLLDYKDGVLKIEVPFDFHKERIEATKSREALNDVFKEIFGCGCKIDCLVNGTARRKKQVSADVILRSVPEESSPAKKVYNHRTNKKIEEIFKGM